MTEIDNRIRGALDEDDKAFLASLDQERGMFTQMGDVLAGLTVALLARGWPAVEAAVILSSMAKATLEMLEEIQVLVE